LAAIYGIKKSLEDVRNHIQHVDQSAHKSDPETYPILGAITWASSDGKLSFTTSLGTNPHGTAFHTLTYDKGSKRFVGGITLGVGNFDLQFERIVPALEAGEAQLARWLTAKKHVSDIELAPMAVSMGPLETPGRQFVRGRFLFTDSSVNASIEDPT